MDIDSILIDNNKSDLHNEEDNEIINEYKIEDIIDDNIIFDEDINKEDIDMNDINYKEELEFDIILENPSDNLN